MARLNECILYRNFEHGEILDKMAELMNAWEQKAPDLKEKEGLFFECANGLVETAGAYGFSGNLWHCYLTFLLVNNENAFSTACEIRGAVNGSINELALNDFGVCCSLSSAAAVQFCWAASRMRWIICCMWRAGHVHFQSAASLL